MSKSSNRGRFGRLLGLAAFAVAGSALAQSGEYAGASPASPAS